MSTAVAPYRQAIQKIEKKFIEAAPDMNFSKEELFALQAFTKNDFLKKVASANPTSASQAVLNVSMSGLSLNPSLAHGYLVPRGGAVIFQPGYQGLIYLALSSGIVKTIEARVVYDNDEFEISFGLDPVLIHKPAFKNAGEVKCAYAVATDADGNKHVEMMTLDQIMAVAMTSEMNKKAGKLTGMWLAHFAEMCRKTVIRRLYKFIPKHNVQNQQAFERLNKAISLEDEGTKPETVDVFHVDVTDIATEVVDAVEPEPEKIVVPEQQTVVVPQPKTSKTPNV